MFDNKKVFLISTLVITALVVLWGVYSYFNNGLLTTKESAGNKTTASSSTNQSNNNADKTNEETKEDEKDTTIEDKEDETTADSENTIDEKNQALEDEDKEDKEKPTVSTADEYVEYTVKQGDTLFSIYKEMVKGYSFADTVKLIVERNKLSNADEISVGKKIFIPTAKEEDNSKYVVKLGDTLTSIAKKLFPNQKLLETVEAIMKENDIDNADSIQVGQVLAIPVSN